LAVVNITNQFLEPKNVEKEKRMRKIASVLLTLVFALFLGACGGMQGVESLDLMNNDDDFARINADLADLQTQLDDLSGSDSVTLQTIIFLQTQINDLKAELEALRVQVNTDNVTINDRLTELERIVSDLESRLSVLEAASAPVANPPMFVSAHRGDTEPETDESRGATIRWTGSSGGSAIVSYNVWAVTVDSWGFFGVPMKLANGTGSSYYWDGHTETLPGEPFVGVNPTPLSAVRLLCVESEVPAKYRFAVTAIDSQGRESSPSVTADEFLVRATRNEEEVY
jgi:cell division protein FtsB